MSQRIRTSILTPPSKRKAMSSVFSKPWLQESLLTCSNKVGLPKSITLWLMILILYISSTTATILIVLPHRCGARNFYLRGSSCSTNIFIKTTSQIHIYTCFFIIYTFFYLISFIYIYTHTKKKKLSIFNQNYVWWQFFIK